MLRSALITLGSLALTTNVAAAQTAAEQNAARIAAAQVEERTPSVVGSDAQSTQPSFEFLASSDSSSVKITAGRRLSSIIQDGTLRASSLTFTLSGPLNKNASLSNIATLDGLANSTSLAASYRRTIAPGFNTFEGRDPAVLLQAARRACAGRPNITAEQRAACAEWVGDPSLYLTDEQIDALGMNPVANPNAATFVYGFEARVGYETFDVMDTTTFQDSSHNETPVSASVFFAYAPSIRPLLFVVGAQYQHRYKAAAEQTLCEPPDPGGVQTCHTGSIVAPAEQEATIVYAEARTLFHTGLVNWPIAVQARISYDNSNEVTGVDVPVFLVRDSDNNLRGGLRFGWRSDTEDVTAGVFVGAAFSLF